MVQWARDGIRTLRYRASPEQQRLTSTDTDDIQISRAPRGLDAATLWFNSLSLPDLAKLVADRFRFDLNTREGQLCGLFLCCQHLAHDPDGEDLLSAPARQAAEDLLTAIGTTQN